MTTETNNLEVANEIRRQLGRESLFLLGASLLVGDSRSLMFSFKGSRKMNKIRITLTAGDDYTIEFFKFSPSKLTCDVVTTREGIFADMLHDVIESTTGVYVSLRGRGSARGTLSQWGAAARS